MKTSTIFNNIGIENIIDELSKSFNGFVNEAYTNLNYEIYKTNTQYIICINVPGIEKKDINMNVNDKNIIEITYKRDRIEGKLIHCGNFRYGNFKQDIDIPVDADPTTISATTKNGVLYITFELLNQNTYSKKKVVIN